jgi:hypothetical protein
MSMHRLRTVLAGTLSDKGIAELDKFLLEQGRSTHSGLPAALRKARRFAVHNSRSIRRRLPVVMTRARVAQAGS